MKDGLFLSEVIDTSKIVIGKLNIIKAPCGSGKTTCAIPKIIPMASDARKVIYLIDTRNAFERLAREEALAAPYFFYADDIVEKPGFDEYPKGKCIVMTYAKFGSYVMRYPNFADNFEIIICDEAHNLVQFARFNKEPNSTSAARNSIKRAIQNGITKVIAITATPELLWYLHKDQNYVVSDTTMLRQYSEKKRIYYASIRQVIRNIPIGKVGALYVGRITQMKEYEAFARECGHNPISIWSTSNKEHPMTEEQLRANEYILQNEALPPQYDMLILNASYETSNNINSPMDYFIIHNTNATHITQARGRCRSDIYALYLYDKVFGYVEVPEKYLNRKLFKEDRDELRQEIGIKNDKGRLIPWDELLQRFTDNGYTFHEGRTDNRPYTYIEML